MMRLKINEAIALGNVLLKIECEKSGKKFVKIIQANIGTVIFKGKRRTTSVQMCELCKGTVTIRPEWVIEICKITGVDANFLFDQPSEFDKLETF